MEKIDLDFPKAMKTLRKKKKMTQGDIYRATGLERSYVSRIESGEFIPKIHTFLKICKALDVSANEFLSYATTKKS